MKREFLGKLGVDPAVIDKIMAEHGKGIEALKGQAGKASGLHEQIDGLKKTIEQRDSQLDGLKKASDTKIKKKINSLQKKNGEAKEKYEAKIRDMTVNFAVETAILEASGKNVHAITSLLDRSKITMDGDQLSGIDEQILALKSDKSSAFMFQETNRDTHNISGARPYESSGKVSDSSTVEKAKKAYDKRPSPDNMASLSRARIDASNNMAQ